MDKLEFLVNKALSRRSFMAGAGSVAAASVVAGCGDNGVVTLPVASTTISDADILTFALNLEYLEAEFYLYAATGAGLSSADAGSGAGTTTGGIKATLTSNNILTATQQQNILNELAYTEQQHVRFLRAALTAAGATVQPRPNINIGTVFNVLASAAGVGSSFNPYASFDAFMVGVFVFEDVGVTAYAGAAPLISTAGIAAGYLGAAAGIMATEAYHAGLARTYLTAQTATQGAAAYPYAGYANKIATLRAQLSGGASTSAATLATGGETLLTIPAGTPPYTTTNPTTISSIVPATSANAIAYARTTDQVLHIVYGTFSPTSGSTTPAAGVSSGGFFPNGLNGNIKTTLS